MIRFNFFICNVTCNNATLCIYTRIFFFRVSESHSIIRSDVRPGPQFVLGLALIKLNGLTLVLVVYAGPRAVIISTGWFVYIFIVFCI